jgi:hypothetical protein
MSSPRDVLTDVKDVARSAADTVDAQFDEYAHGEERPLRNYAAFMTVYVGAVGVAALVGRRRGVRLPERIGAGDLALMAVATHRVSRLLAKDSITAPVRAPFTRYVEPAGAGEVNEEVRGTGWRHAIGELVACPFCLGQWIGTAFVAGFLFAPRATRVVAGVFGVVAASDALQFGYAALQKAE